MGLVTNVQNDRREGLFTQHPRCYRRMAGCQTLPDRFLPTKTREKKYRNDGSEIAVAVVVGVLSLVCCVTLIGLVFVKRRKTETHTFDKARNVSDGLVNETTTITLAMSICSIRIVSAVMSVSAGGTRRTGSVGLYANCKARHGGAVRPQVCTPP